MEQVAGYKTKSDKLTKQVLGIQLDMDALAEKDDILHDEIIDKVHTIKGLQTSLEDVSQKWPYIDMACVEERIRILKEVTINEYFEAVKP